MKRLIYANVLIRDINADIYRTESEKSYDRCLVYRQPTVDAVEVVHGYTIPAEEPKKVLLDRKCGICDQLMLSTDAFCPMCGAKMDGDMENNRQAEVIR